MVWGCFGRLQTKSLTEWKRQCDFQERERDPAVLDLSPSELEAFRAALRFNVVWRQAAKTNSMPFTDLGLDLHELHLLRHLQKSKSDLWVLGFSGGFKGSRKAIKEGKRLEDKCTAGGTTSPLFQTDPKDWTLFAEAPDCNVSPWTWRDMLPSFEKPRKPSSNSSSVHSSTASNSIGSSPASYGVHSSAGSTANKAAAANSTAGAQPSDDSARSTPALPPTTAADGAYITPVVPRTSDGGAHTTLPVPRTGGNPAAVKSPWGHGEDTEQLAQLRLFMRSQQQRVHRRLDDLWPLNAASDHPGKVGGLSLR